MSSLVSLPHMENCKHEACLYLPINIDRAMAGMKKSGLKTVSVLVAAVVGTTPAVSMAFGLGQATHRLEIGKPLSIRIPVGSITGEFSPSCVALTKSEDDLAGENFPAGMRVSMIPGDEPALLISGPVVKQPIVEFTVVSKCPNTKYERTYQLLPDILVSDEPLTANVETKAVPLQEEMKVASLPFISPTTAMPQSRTGLSLRLDGSLDTHKHTYSRKQPVTRIGRETVQKFEKMRSDLDAAASSLDRLSSVVTEQMDVQLKSANELSRVSALVVEHDEKIATMNNKMTALNDTVRHHDETLSHRGIESLINSFGGGLLGFCFSAAGFFFYNRKRADQLVELAVEPAVTETKVTTKTPPASHQASTSSKASSKFYCTCGKAFNFAGTATHSATNDGDEDKRSPVASIV